MKKLGLVLSLMGVLTLGFMSRPVQSVSAIAPCTAGVFTGPVSVKFSNIGQPSVNHKAKLTYDGMCNPTLVITPVVPGEPGSVTLSTQQIAGDGWDTVKTSKDTWKATLKDVGPQYGKVNVAGVERDMKVMSTIIFKPTTSNTLYFKLNGFTSNNIAFEITSSGVGLPLQ